MGLFQEAAQRSNNPTHCLSFDDDPSANPHLNSADWTVVRTYRGTLGRNYALISKRSAVELRHLVEFTDIVCIHLLYRYHAIWAASCARRFGKAVIVVPHGGLDPYVFTYRGLRKRAWLRAYHDLLFRDSLVLYATDREREKAAAAVGNVNAKSLLWPMDDEICHTADSLLRVPTTPRRLLFVGRLHPGKRVIETIRAFCRMGDTGWQLVIIGAESSEISRSNLGAAAGPEWNRSVVYRGVLDRQALYSEYGQASALILASHKENFGHVVAEAMRFGIPVIISEDVDLSTVVRHSGAGLVVPVSSEPVRSEDDILEGLTTFIRSTPDELEQFSQSARNAARQNFDFRTFTDSYNTILSSVVSGGAEGTTGRDLRK